MSVSVIFIAGRWGDASVLIPQGRKQVDRVRLQRPLCCISWCPARASVGDTGQDWKEEARGSHFLYVSALEGPPMLQDAGFGGKWGPDAALSWEPWLPFNLLLFFLSPAQYCFQYPVTNSLD